MRQAARITGVGCYLPQRRLTNADLERMVDTSNQWIVERCGIRERRIAAAHETSSSMGAEAARRALASAELEPGDIDLVIAGTCTPDGMFPATATLIQDAIGAPDAAAFDVNAACTGFLVALSTAGQFIATGNARRALVVGTGDDVAHRRLDGPRHLRAVRRRRRRDRAGRRPRRRAGRSGVVPAALRPAATPTCCTPPVRRAPVSTASPSRPTS